MSSEDHVVSFSLEVNVDKAMENVRKWETVLYRSLGLARRLGLPENIDGAVAKIQRATMAANQLRLTLIALEMSAGPVGWALAGIGLLTTALTTGEIVGDILYDMDRGTMGMS